jgi:16S rRNA (guanine527-N7)-methyltransferase
VKQGSSDAAARKRVSALAERWELDQRACLKLLELLELVRDDPRAATSVRDPARAAQAHVADSLSALPLLDAAGAGRVADLGSGAGFPGLPVALARPALEVDLVESARRKCEFLRNAARRLDATGVRVVNRRAEEWALEAGRDRYDAVLVRALGSLPELVEYAAPLLALGGRLIAWKGRRDADEEDRGSAAADALGMRPVQVVRAEPYRGSRDHYLHLYEKVRVTPERFPRRPGMARKRPVA